MYSLEQFKDKRSDGKKEEIAGLVGSDVTLYREGLAEVAKDEEHRNSDKLPY